MVVMMNTLSVGEYSQPVEFTDERGKKGVRIVYLKNRSEPHRENIKDDFSRISQRALEEKKNDALEKWFTEKIPTYYIKIDDDFKTCSEMEKWLHPANATVKN
jgi:peptidyl-prolyl cis-trans isomerase SurA